MSSPDLKISQSTVVPDRKQYSRIRQLGDLLEKPQVINIALLIVLLIAAWFRFHGINWDEGRHLHPDERFLSNVANDLKWPDNFANYFDPDTSTLSPYSLPNMGLYVYGTLPVYIVKWVAIQLDLNNYDKITLVGRVFSGLLDTATIFLLFLIAKRLYGKKVGLLAAALLSLSVMNIQLSHFYTVDTFANLFVVGTIYLILYANDSGRWLNHALTGLLFGLGLASKLSVATLIVPIVISAGLTLYRRSRSGDWQFALEHVLVRFLTALIVAFLTFRIFQPIAFNGPGFWNWSFNHQWVEDITEQQKILVGDSDLPWVGQWTDRSMTFALYNIVFWGMGIPLGLASLAGFALATYELIWHRKLEHLLLVPFIGITFFYHASIFVKFMRYFLPIYPFLILFAAYLIMQLWKYATTPQQSLSTKLGFPSSDWRHLIDRFHLSRGLVLSVAGIVVCGTLIYALAFSSIYSRTNTRVAASRWIYQNLAQGSTLANEHWDDWLPIGGLDGYTSYGDQGMFNSVSMNNYEDDNPDKLDWMVDNLAEADYIILSSNRLYDSIPRLPMRYPMTSRYYKLLFSGELGFKLIKEFNSYPTILGIPFPDQIAEESFTVYDHPRVQIFQKTAAFNAAKIRRELSDGVIWEDILHLPPRQASANSKSLELSSNDEALYQNVATWSSTKVNEGSWGNHVPVLAWFLMLELIGLIALPLTFITFRPFADRGYIFSKVLGLLIVAWGAWLIASVRLAPFTWWTVLTVMTFLALATILLITKQKWNELIAFLRARWQLIAVEEVLFWLFFALLLIIRMRNPDLWHPGLGGEKPMDVAYLTAIVRSPYFPPYDPWFSGGYINYYYFGFVLVGTLIHITGIVPSIAYNLAVPTLFAFTAMGAFTVTLNFAERRQNDRDIKVGWLGVGRAALFTGLAGAVFVAVIGNLGQVKLLWDGIRNLSSNQPLDHASLKIVLSQFVDGLNNLLGGQHLSLHKEWWYWNATRLIPPGGGEAGPINEMPFFTFLFGDLHAHMMALPYTLLILGFALNLIHSQPLTKNGTNPLPMWRDPVEILTLVLMALTTGALWTMNTWDFPAYSVLAAVALFCRQIVRRRLDMQELWAVVWRTALFVIVGRLLFLPYHQNFASTYIDAEWWKGSHTPLWAFLLVHGFFLFVLSSYLIAEFLRGSGHNTLVRSLRLNLRYWQRVRRMQRLFEQVVHPSPDYRLMIDSSQLALVLILIVTLINHVVGLIIALITLSILLLFSARPDPLRQFLLCMIAMGLVFTALVEIVVLKGDISRMNTVFKFYLQVWVLWGVASAAVLPRLAVWFSAPRLQKRLSLSKFAEVRKWMPEIAQKNEKHQRLPVNHWSRYWWWAFGMLLAASFLYPLTAAPARMSDRFENSVSTTLDGTAYQKTSIYMDDGRAVDLRWDSQAFEWLKQNVDGIPTILEANTPLYRWGSRVSIYTGLPTVIGWDWHEKQQHSILPGQIIDRRIEDVRTIYESNDLTQIKFLLDLYHVKYIYVGSLERLYYNADGLKKFDQPSDLWSLVYQNEQVQIYQVH